MTKISFKEAKKSTQKLLTSLSNLVLFETIRNKNKMSYESNQQKLCKEELNRSYFDANYIKAGNMMNVTPSS